MSIWGKAMAHGMEVSPLYYGAMKEAETWASAKWMLAWHGLEKALPQTVIRADLTWRAPGSAMTLRNWRFE